MKVLKKTKASRPKQTTATVPVNRSQDRFVLRLFVAGATIRSNQAVQRVRELCETSPKGRVQLEVIDIYQQPELARENQIVATPTLIIQLPAPVRRFIGNLTNISELICLMDLDEKGRNEL